MAFETPKKTSKASDPSTPTEKYPLINFPAVLRPEAEHLRHQLSAARKQRQNYERKGQETAVEAKEAEIARLVGRLEHLLGAGTPPRPKRQPTPTVAKAPDPPVAAFSNGPEKEAPPNRSFLRLRRVLVLKTGEGKPEAETLSPEEGPPMAVPPAPRETPPTAPKMTAPVRIRLLTGASREPQEEKAVKEATSSSSSAPGGQPEGTLELPSTANASTTSPLRRLRRVADAVLEPALAHIKAEPPPNDTPQTPQRHGQQPRPMVVRNLRRTRESLTPEELALLPQPQSTWDTSHCAARTWADGLGLQCHWAPRQGSDLCSMHAREVSKRRGLAHGRIDTPVPDAKVHDFLEAAKRGYAESKMPAGSESESSSSQEVEVTPRRKTPRSKKRRKQLRPAGEVPQPIKRPCRKKCVARVWADGRGLQCSRKRVQGLAFCTQHQRDCELRGGPPHGRIDEAVPEDKVAAFKDYKSPTEDWIVDDDLTSSDSDLPEVAPTKRKGGRRGKSIACKGLTPFDRLSEEICVHILEWLTQGEVFRAACVCSSLGTVANQPRLFTSLDLRPVGLAFARRGRRIRSSGAVNLTAIQQLLSQPRFATVVELNFGGVYLGPGLPEQNQLLKHAARLCPAVCRLSLGMAAPREMWSDLGRRLPAPLERVLRGWWRTRPFYFEAYGRNYELN